MVMALALALALVMAMAKKTLMTIIAYNKWVHYGHLTKGEQGTTRRVSNPLPPTLI